MKNKLPKFLKEWKNYSLNEDEKIDADNINEKVHDIESLLSNKINNILGKVSWINDIKALYRYITDGKANIIEKIEIFLVLLYFINPLDIFPDFIPFIGYIDDGLLIVYLVTKLREKIEIYR